MHSKKTEAVPTNQKVIRFEVRLTPEQKSLLLCAAIPTSCHLRDQRGMTTQFLTQQSPSCVQLAKTGVHARPKPVLNC